MPTRGAANSIASGNPSSLRQISATSEAFASVSAKSSTTAVTRSTNNCTAGNIAASAAVSVDASCGLSRAPRRCSRSPATRKGLPAGREHADTSCAGEKRLREVGRLFDNVLAIVEKQQRPPVSEGGGQSREGVIGTDFQTKRCRDGANDQTRIVEWREINQPYAVLVGGDHLLGNGERGRCLADSPRPDNRHETLT
jgi:hypothetical protein